MLNLFNLSSNVGFFCGCPNHLLWGADMRGKIILREGLTLYLGILAWLSQDVINTSDLTVVDNRHSVFSGDKHKACGGYLWGSDKIR